MIAGFIFLRLRGILGKRTGFEGKAPPQFQEVLKKVQLEKNTKQNQNFDETFAKQYLVEKFSTQTIAKEYEKVLLNTVSIK